MVREAGAGLAHVPMRAVDARPLRVDSGAADIFYCLSVMHVRVLVGDAARQVTPFGIGGAGEA